LYLGGTATLTESDVTPQLRSMTTDLVYGIYQKFPTMYLHGMSYAELEHFVAKVVAVFIII
jgi:hypothetical protein